MIVHESLYNGVSQTRDLLDIVPFLLAATYDLLGTQSTVKEQVGQALLTLVWKECLYDLPYFTAVGLVLHRGLFWQELRACCWS